MRWCHLLFVCLFYFVPLEIFFTHLETSPLPMKGKKLDLSSALMAIKQGRFFNVPTLISRMQGERSTTTPPPWWHLNIFFRTTGPISTKLVTMHIWMKGLQTFTKFGSNRRKFYLFFKSRCWYMYNHNIAQTVGNFIRWAMQCGSHASCFWFSIMLQSFPVYSM